MPNRNYERGTRFEWALKKQLEREGYTVLRSAGSHGFADLVAINAHWVAFIQCKCYQPTEKELARIRASVPALPPNATLEVWVKLPRKAAYAIDLLRK